MMINIKEKLPLLKDYFNKRETVLMAYLFGSYEKGQATSESDVDIGIYYKPKGRSVEWEEVGEYHETEKIWSDVEKIVGQKTDLVVMNQAPATLVYDIIQNGRVIVSKDQNYYWRLYLLISDAAEYFRDFITDYWLIKERSKSLSDLEKTRLIKAVDFLEAEVKEFASFKKIDQFEYEKNAVTKRNLERWAENLVNSSIDIAKILLASAGKKIPDTYRKILEDLAFLDGFERNDAQKLASFAKLRNILAHEYLDIRFSELEKLIKGGKEVYEGLVAFTKRKIKEK